MEQKSGDIDTQLLALNGLTYSPPAELSLASAHRLRVFPALRESYAAGTSGYVDLTVGSDLIDCQNSFIEFRIKVKTSDSSDVRLPANGAVSVFRETVVRDRAGAEIDRSQYHNVMIRDHLKTNCTFGPAATLGSVTAPNATLKSDDDTNTVCVPLAWINPFFSSPKLLPTNIIGSLRLEFILAPAIEALIMVDNSESATYEISNLNIWLDCYSMADSALRSMQMIASNSGLAYPWVSQHATVNTSDGTYANFVSLKSASRALGASLHIAKSADLVDWSKDGMANEEFKVSSSQWSLGSMYMPVKRLDTIPAHFCNTLYANDAFGHCREYASELTFAEFQASYGTLNTTLERSGVLDAQGSATSSSRPLICDVNWDTSVDRTTILFLAYQKVALCFASGSTVIKA
jgi:hypothetical protein